MPDPDLELERALAPLLERPLVEPEPVAELEQRAGRARRRRWATRLGAAGTAAAIAVGVVALLPDSANQVVRTTPPADAPPSQPELLPRGEPFRAIGLRDARTVHREVLGGQEWQLVTGFDGEGRPCVELARELGAHRLCGNDFYPWRPFEESSESIAGSEVRFGAAAPSVARMHLVLEGGRSIDATILEPLPGYPIKVWFVSIPKGDRVRIVAALDPDGLPAGG